MADDLENKTLNRKIGKISSFAGNLGMVLGMVAVPLIAGFLMGKSAQAHLPMYEYDLYKNIFGDNCLVEAIMFMFLLGPPAAYGCYEAFSHLARKIAKRAYNSEQI